MKTCSKCKEDKEDSEFYLIQRKDRVKPHLYHHCKSCCSIHKAGSKEYYRDWELKKNYGISLEEYFEQCKLRDNVCDICFNKVKTLHVDHSHDTGKVRGYLCGSCNRGIGLLKDSPTTCRKAAVYLEEHSK